MHSAHQRLVVVLLLAPASIAAAENCPWLNAATAAGVLGGPVTGMTVQHAKSGDDASCEFLRRAGTVESELRIATETMPDPSKDFPSYAARCHSVAEALTAIGNQAVVCSDDRGGGRAEMVLGRVRNRAFEVRISTGDRSGAAGALREKARQIAEQVAGILF